MSDHLTFLVMACDLYKCYHGYVAVVTCCIGIITNIINVVVWSRQLGRSSVNLILKVLSFTNLLILTAYLVFVSYTFLATGPTSKYYHSEIGAYTILIAHHVFVVCLTWSAWNAIVLMSFRFVKVCFPEYARIACTLERAKLALVIVFTLVILASCMNFFYYQVVPCDMITSNQTCHGYWLAKSHIVRNNDFFNTTFFWVFALVRGLLPSIAFVFLCIGMIISLIKLSRNQYHNHQDIHSDFFKKTVGLFVLLVLFTATILPVVVYNFKLQYRDRAHTQFFFFMDDYNDENIVPFMQIMSASIDILIYIPMSRGYRRQLRLLCCGRNAPDDGLGIQEDIGPVMWPAQMAPLFDD